MPTKIFQNGVYPDAGYAGCDDTYIVSGVPNTNYNANGWTEVQKTTTTVRNTLIKFDVSAIPSNAIVVSATLTLVARSRSGTPFNVSTYPLKRAWVESQATWNVYSTGHAWGTAGGTKDGTDIGSKESTAAMPSTGNAVFSIPIMVQGWVDGSLTNNGVNLITDTVADNKWLYGWDSEHATSANRPSLEVIYRLPSVRDLITCRFIPGLR